MLMSLLHKPSDAVRQFVSVDLPVTKSTVVGKTGILDTEPAVIHHEKFATHRCNIRHHLVHARLIDVEIHTFPAVQQDLAKLITMSQLIFTTPFVKVTADSAQSFIRICKSQFRGLEDFLMRKDES